MTTIYLLGIMYLDNTWSTPWGSEMTNDQGRLMILYIIDYIIKVNRASSVLNVGPRELQIENTFRSDQQWCADAMMH